MIAAALIILTLAHEGYWFGGEPAEVRVRWAAEGAPPSVFVWELRYRSTPLGRGEAPLPSGEGEHILTLTPPRVRIRTPLTLAWRLVEADDRDEIDRGTTAVHVFPDTLLEPLDRLVLDRDLVVLGGGGLAALLEGRGIAHRVIDSPEMFPFNPAALALIEQGALPSTGPLQRSALQDAVARGLDVLVLYQGGSDRLADIKVVPRVPPSSYAWRPEHELFRGLSDADLRSLASSKGVASALRLEADVPAVELAWWPVETPATAGRPPEPVDAAVAVRSIGSGRVVLWQFPLGDFRTDPRAQIVLVNAIDYLLTPPQPTPSRRERLDAAGTKEKP